MIYEQPQLPPKPDLPTLENPTLENPTQENPTLEKPTQELSLIHIFIQILQQLQQQHGLQWIGFIAALSFVIARLDLSLIHI